MNTSNNDYWVALSMWSGLSAVPEGHGTRSMPTVASTPSAPFETLASNSRHRPSSAALARTRISSNSSLVGSVGLGEAPAPGLRTGPALRKCEFLTFRPSRGDSRNDSRDDPRTFSRGSRTFSSRT